MNGLLSIASERAITSTHSAGKPSQLPPMKLWAVVVASRLLDKLRICYAKEDDFFLYLTLCVVPKRAFLPTRTVWCIATVVFHFCLKIS